MRSFSPVLAVALALLAAAEPALAGPRKPKKTPPPAPEPKVKVLTVASLAGADEAEVRRKLGEPELTRAEGAGAMWTYRLPDCALMVFFQREGGQPFKFTGASAGPLARGGANPDPDACLAKVKLEDDRRDDRR